MTTNGGTDPGRWPRVLETEPFSVLLSAISEGCASSQMLTGGWQQASDMENPSNAPRPDGKIIV